MDVMHEPVCVYSRDHSRALHFSGITVKHITYFYAIFFYNVVI